MVQAGFSKESVKTLWDVVVPFAKYAFNKAHSAAYGVVSYWMAYLKAHYPTEYMAALLTSQKDNKDKLAVYLGECRHMGITVLPPDVNASRAQFSAVDEDVRFGLSAVRNVGINVVDAIVAVASDALFLKFHFIIHKHTGGHLCLLLQNLNSLLCAATLSTWQSVWSSVLRSAASLNLWLTT